MEDDAKLLAEKVSTTKYRDLKVFYDYLLQENHANIMHQAVFNSFKLLFPKKTIAQKLLDLRI
jgi:hypothetical protein